MNWKTLVRLSLIVMLMFLGAVAANAQTTDEGSQPPLVETEGRIQAINADLLVLNGLFFDISQALIEDDVRLVVGEPVEIYAQWIDGALVAVYIVDEDDDDWDDDIEIIGVIEALDTVTLTVNGMALNITNAVFEDPIRLGDFIRAEARLVDGDWMVYRVELDDDDNDDRDDDRRRDDDDYDVTVRGTLQAISGNMITVNGRQIDVSRATFDDDVRVGEMVEVEFYRIDGELVALYVDDDDDDSDDDRSNNDDDFEESTVAITRSQAAAIALEVYPNAIVTDIYRETLGDRMVWEVELSNGVEIYVDAMTGARLRIDVPGRRDDSSSSDGVGSPTSPGTSWDDDDDDDWDDDRNDDWDDDDDDDWDDDDDDDWDDDDDDDWDDDDDDDDDD